MKNTIAPRPLLSSTIPNEKPRPALSHTTNPPPLKVTMVIRGQFEPQQSSLSKSMTESSGHHSCKTTGKTSPDIYKWREEALKQKEIARERKETRLKLTYRSVQLNKERAWFQKMKGFNINPL